MFDVQIGQHDYATLSYEYGYKKNILASICHGPRSKPFGESLTKHGTYLSRMRYNCDGNTARKNQKKMLLVLGIR